MKTKQVAKLVAVAGVSLGLTACAGSHGFSSLQGSEHGVFELRADSRGLESYAQGLQGMVEGAKNESGAAPYAQETYRQKERERTRRRVEYVSPFASFLSMGKNKRGASQPLDYHSPQDKRDLQAVIEGN